MIGYPIIELVLAAFCFWCCWLYWTQFAGMAWRVIFVAMAMTGVGCVALAYLMIRGS
jgi:hypothetical protein